MGSYNTISAEVKLRLGNRDDIDSRLPLWINDAYFELLLSPRFSFYELDKQATMLTINTLRAYDLPDDLWIILDIRDWDNNRKLSRKHWSQYDKRSRPTGAPTSYCRFGLTVELDPTPDDEYQLILRYRYRPNDLTADSSTLLGREWDEMITTLAVAKGCEALELPERAAQHRRLFEQMVSNRITVAELEDMDSEITIAPRMY